MLQAALYPGLFRNAIYHSGSYSPGMESGIKNQGFDDDLLQIAIYDKTGVDDGEIYWLEGFETIRATGETYTFTLPAERGKEIHLFAFFLEK